MDADTQPTEESGGTIDLGNYEIIRQRLLGHGAELSERARALNERRKDAFGGQELTVIGNERVRTENNCVPRDIIAVSDVLLFGYNVFLGLRSETHINDVFSLHQCVEQEDGTFDMSALPLDSGRGFLTDSRFQREFGQLYEYYKDARLLQLRRTETKLLAVFQMGNNIGDVRVFRWAIDAEGDATYIDNRGERDHVFPPSHDFEWIATSADMHRRGHHPHINILDEIFVETVGGDLTVKVEDNTESGAGIYAEPVDDSNQSLDDAEFYYAKVGTLILLKILPYREEQWRYLIYNTRRQHVLRVDAIGQACVQLPEDHGIVFPGGYYLQTGDYKVFEGMHEGLEFKRAIRSPNGEDVLYIFHRRLAGEYVLFPYNLVSKEVQNPIHSSGYSLLDDGRLIVFRASKEPTRVHPMQIWRTPFVSAEFAARAPTDGSFLGKIGNADLVRGISDSFTLNRLVNASEPTRQTFEDIIAAATRLLDSYYWLGNEEVGDLQSVIVELRKTAELVIDEFEKVQLLRQRAADALAQAQSDQRDVVRDIHPERWDRIEKFLEKMTALRNQRGKVITLREVRYIDLDALQALEDETIREFDRVSASCVDFLLAGEAFAPVEAELEELEARIPSVEKTADAKPIAEDLDKLSEGLGLLGDVVGSLEVDDPTQRTQILEQISEVLAKLNRTRAVLEQHRKAKMAVEGRAEFAAQFKLFGQSVASALALCDTPEKCDEQLSRLMVQLEDLEAKFSEFDEYLGDLATKREEVYDAITARKQTLLDERQRRIENLFKAGQRILEGVGRRARGFKTDEELNAYFASDPMVHKLRQIAEQLGELSDSVKADEVLAKLKGAQQDALRGLRDRLDLYEEGSLIRLGRHRFSVNTQPLEMTMVPRDEGMALHLTGTEFYELVDDEAFNASRDYWQQTLVSEDPNVYRAEYLAASILFAAEQGRAGQNMSALLDASREEGGLLALVRSVASERYDEGYDRGIHDADAALILTKLLTMWTTAGLLRFSPRVRALASLGWLGFDEEKRKQLHLKARNLGRLRGAFQQSPALAAFGVELGDRIGSYLEEIGLEHGADELSLAGRYLLEELTEERPAFVASADALALRDAFVTRLDKDGLRTSFNDDVEAMQGDVRGLFELIRAWLAAFVAQDEALSALEVVLDEAAVLILADRRLERRESKAMTHVEVTGLIGQHRRLDNGKLSLRLDEFLGRLNHFVQVRVPGYRAYRTLRQQIIERERERLRLSEYLPRVMTAFVRNKLINDVYLPMIGDNLAKQIGAAGESKRTDLMGLLLLISPPGYGKTTLMEYIASRLGLVFMKVNGPSLGHGVLSFDPAEAPNATSRQEVEKINLAFEMGNNVMLYLDDIQHTNPELLQKFISLCDAQRKVEGVWKGRTRTYDFRGKKFCVVMAGNPYTESGEKFQIPDMLANRADTYNLGDILGDYADAFALSYVENALTSSPVLAPLATRDYSDVYKLVDMAKGIEVATTDLAHGYSSVELGEIVSVLKMLFRVRDVLLKVNKQYITSAAMDDAFRTEPRFQLQGSYRNMNKLAEKVVSAMNDEELDRTIDAHYQGESQTLTSGAEHNLLKFGELRDTLTADQAERWEKIKRDFRRIQVSGGADDDPVARVTGTIGGLGEQLELMRETLGKAAVESRRAAKESARQPHALAPAMEKIEQSLQTLASQQNVDVAEKLAMLGEVLEKMSRPKLEVSVQTLPPPGVEELLAQQVAIVERTLVPLVRTTTQNLQDGAAIRQHLDELIGLLRTVDEQIRDGAPAKAIRETIRTAAIERKDPAS